MYIIYVYAMNESGLTESAKVSFTHVKSCDHTLGKWQYYATFCTHGATLHGTMHRNGTKYVIEFKKMLCLGIDHVTLNGYKKP